MPSQLRTILGWEGFFAQPQSAGSIPFLQEYLAIENRGYKTEVRLRGLN